MPVPAQPKRKKTWLIVAIVLLGAMIVGAGAWFMFGRKQPAAQTDQSASVTTPEQTLQTSTDDDVPDAANTKEYSNGFLGLKLKHPDTWTATEANNGVRLESPSFRYQTDSKGMVEGNFRVYIRKGARDQDGKYIGRGYAIRPSEKLVYSDPAPGQRTDTNLTLFGLDEPTGFAFFLIAGNYNLQKGDTLGPDYGKEAETYIIAGGFSEPALTDDLATNPVNSELLTNSNAYKQALEILKSLSLR